MIHTKPFSAAHATFPFHTAARVSAAVFLLIQAGCNSDGGVDRVVDPVVDPAVATILASNTSETLVATAGFAVQPPSVIVKDQRGAGMGGVAVTFTVSAGGGTVAGGSTTTNSAGIAGVVSWVLGATPGMNTLTASAAGLPSVTFTATGLFIPPPCSSDVLAYEFGTTATGALNSEDCLSDAVYTDFYSTTLSGVGAYLFKLSATFDAYLYLGTAQIFNGGLIAYNNNESSATTNAAIKALLPPGPYTVAVTSWIWGETGAYSLSSTTTSGANAKGTAKLEILDKGGKVIRTYSSDDTLPNPDPAIDPEGYNRVCQLTPGAPHCSVPLYWAAPNAALSSRLGMHRFSWDLRYQPIEGTPPSESATGAVPHRTYFAGTTPWAPPGSYTVRLTADGKTYTQPLSLVLDPRVKTPASALAQVAALSREMYDDAVALRAGYVEARKLSDQLTSGGDAALKSQIDSIAPPPARGPRQGFGFGQAPSGPPTLESARTAMMAAAMSMQGADVAPTARQVDAVAKARAQYKEVMARWKSLAAKRGSH